MDYISSNNISDVGAKKLGEVVSKLLNLIGLNLKFE
jgi:hypothetical protein